MPKSSDLPINKNSRKRWHPYHSQGDIILQADNGMLFGADSWRLAKASTTFADMLDIPQPTSHIPTDSSNTKSKTEQTGRSPPISMEVSPHVLNIFLNFVNVSIPALPQVSIATLTSLEELCEKFNLKAKIQVLIKDKLDSKGKRYPWELLVNASKWNNVTLGKKALEYMGPSGFFYVHKDTKKKADQKLPEGLKYKPFWERFHLISPAWQKELSLRLFNEPSFEQLKTTTRAAKKFEKIEGRIHMSVRDWDTALRKFNPSM